MNPPPLRASQLSLQDLRAQAQTQEHERQRRFKENVRDIVLHQRPIQVRSEERCQQSKELKQREFEEQQKIIKRRMKGVA